MLQFILHAFLYQEFCKGVTGSDVYMDPTTGDMLPCAGLCDGHAPKSCDIYCPG